LPNLVLNGYSYRTKAIGNKIMRTRHFLPSYSFAPLWLPQTTARLENDDSF